MKYAILSDIHAHNWSVFSHTLPTGVNSRLQIILNEMLRAAQTLKKEGGSLMVIAGDLFHTRGVMDPEVLNPVRATIAAILEDGIDIVAIPGNHDLKSRETSELSSAIQNLEQISITGGAFRVINKPSFLHVNGVDLAFVPWCDTNDLLLENIEALSKNTDWKVSNVDLFIHAGIDGVLSGSPASGLTSTKLASYGFKRVFAGHFHNHKDFGDGVFSIGATTHHNWGDIGTKAGFMIVDDNVGSFWFSSHAPGFIDVSGMPEEDLMLAAPGNYVRFRGPAMTNDQVNDLRDALKKEGALGVSIEVPRTTTVTRTTSPKKGVSTRDSIGNFVDTETPPAGLTTNQIKKRALEVFDRSQAVVEET